jgi:hypothetical protein
MCFAEKGRLQGWAAKLLLARRKSRYSEHLGQICLAANGPAIWGGCVTRRSIRAGSLYFSQKAVTMQGAYGALFAVRVQVLLSITRVAVHICLGARNLSRCRNLIVGRCACQGARTVANLSWMQEQKQKV